MKVIIARLTIIAAFILTSAAYLPAGGRIPVDDKKEVTITTASTNCGELYKELNLKQAGLSETVFQLALKGWKKLKAKGDIAVDILSICDFSQSCNNKRLYIIDITSHKLLYNILVAHGKNTGNEFARYFSNEPSSLKSSLGFYVTKESYTGEHGLALKLSGKEPGFNDKAEERAIVMHSASYADEDFVHQWGVLGRSWGCPAVSPRYSEKVIKLIRGGSCMFIYYPDKLYLATSSLLK